MAYHQYSSSRKNAETAMHRPLTEKYSSLQNHAISERRYARSLDAYSHHSFSPVFCLLLNRVQFLKDSSQLSINTLSISRANLCEMLAIRVLRKPPTPSVAFSAGIFDSGGWSERTLPLASLLLTPWALFQGASEVVINKVSDDYDDDTLVDLAGNALEVRDVRDSPINVLIFGTHVDGDSRKCEEIHSVTIRSESDR